MADKLVTVRIPKKMAETISTLGNKNRRSREQQLAWMIEQYMSDNSGKKDDNHQDLLRVLQDTVTLIDDMSRFIGSMVLNDYELFDTVPLELRKMIKGMKGE